MPRFVLKDMEALYLEEYRSSVNLLISILESVPVNPKGSSTPRKTKERPRPRQVFFGYPLPCPLHRET